MPRQGVLEQYTCNGTAAQMFRFAYTDSGYFQIINPNGKCVGVRGAGQGDYVLIEQETCNGAYSQQWMLQSTPYSTIQVVARHSGKCMDVTGAPPSTANNTVIAQEPCGYSTDYFWNMY